jgi:outer membrane protein
LKTNFIGCLVNPIAKVLFLWGFNLATACSIMFILSGCYFWSIDNDVSQTPQTPWKAPEESIPKRTLSAGPVYSGQPMDLSELIDFAYSNSPLTRQSWQQARYMASQYGVAKTAWLPTGNLEASFGQVKNVFYFPPSSGNAATATSGGGVDAKWTTAYAGSVSLSWLLFDFGGRIATVNAAKKALWASNFSYNQALQDLALTVETAYFNLHQAEQAVIALQSNLEDAKYSLESAEKKLKTGLGNLQDMLIARSDYFSVMYNLEDAQAKVEAARANLAVATGLPISTRIQIVGPQGDPESDLLEQQVSELIAESFKQRPSLLSAYANLRSSEDSVTAGKTVFLPQVSFGYTQMEAVPTSSSLSSFITGQFGLVAQWNVFEFFTDRFQLLGLIAQQRINEQNVRQTELSIMGEVWTYYYSFSAAHAQIKSARALLEASVAAFNASKISYTSGRSDFLTLLRSQNALASARLQDVTAHANFAVSLANLTHSLGRMDMRIPREILPQNRAEAVQSELEQTILSGEENLVMPSSEIGPFFNN